jgi:ankyrin repeat protein
MTFDNSLEDLIIKGDENSLLAFLQSNKHTLLEKTSLGVSPLMLSCYYKKPTITKLMIGFMPNINFFEACAAGALEIVKAYLQKDAEIINSYSEDGFTGLGLASYLGNFEIAEYLIQEGALVNLPSNNNFNVFPLHSAVAGNYTEITKILIENNAEVNIKQQSGITPLHAAAKNGNIEIIIMLLEKGAAVDIRMEGGKLPSDLALENGHHEIAEILS